MNREDIIRMAQEAISLKMEDHVWTMSTTHLEHFANAIANNQRAKLALWMMSQGYATGHGDSIEKLLEELEWQIEERIKNEREACAKLAAEPQCWPLPSFTHQPSDRTIGRIEGEKEMSRSIAAAIRARGRA